MKKEEIKNFIPFGDEWKKEILKLKKLDIVNMFARIGRNSVVLYEKKIKKLEEQNEQLRDELYDSINGNLGNIKAGKL
jgi:hypothetical protein